MDDILYDVSGSAETEGVVDVSKGKQRAADDLLCGICHPLQPLPVGLCAAGVLHCHSVGHQALDGGTVEGHQQLCVLLFLPV